jgi:hypothetical protein
MNIDINTKDLVVALSKILNFLKDSGVEVTASARQIIEKAYPAFVAHAFAKGVTGVVIGLILAVVGSKLIITSMKKGEQIDAKDKYCNMTISCFVIGIFACIVSLFCIGACVPIIIAPQYYGMMDIKDFIAGFLPNGGN